MNKTKKITNHMAGCQNKKMHAKLENAEEGNRHNGKLAGRQSA